MAHPLIFILVLNIKSHIGISRDIGLVHWLAIRLIGALLVNL